MMEFPHQWVRQTLRRSMVRCRIARQVGGISAMAVVDKKTTVPGGWEYDEITAYYVPQGTFEKVTII